MFAVCCFVALAACNEIEGLYYGEEATSYCGDHFLDAGEVCDGGLPIKTCADVVGEGSTGILTCLPDCSGFDTSGCTVACVDCGEKCGNGVVDAGEACDGLAADWASGKLCYEYDSKFAANASLVRCSSDCRVITDECTTCGNNIVDAGEECDVVDGVAVFRGEKTCEDYDPRVYGSLRCTDACLVDSGGCFVCSVGDKKCVMVDGVGQLFSCADNDWPKEGEACADGFECLEGNSSCTPVEGKPCTSDLCVSGMLSACVEGELGGAVVCDDGNSCKSETECGDCKDGAVQCRSGAVSTCSGGVWGEGVGCESGSCNDAFDGCVPAGVFCSSVDYDPVTKALMATYSELAKDLVSTMVFVCHSDISRPAGLWKEAEGEGIVCSAGECRQVIAESRETRYCVLRAGEKLSSRIFCKVGGSGGTPVFGSSTYLKVDEVITVPGTPECTESEVCATGYCLINAEDAMQNRCVDCLDDDHCTEAAAGKCADHVCAAFEADSGASTSYDSGTKVLSGEVKFTNHSTSAGVPGSTSVLSKIVCVASGEVLTVALGEWVDSGTSTHTGEAGEYFVYAGEVTESTSDRHCVAAFSGDGGVTWVYAKAGDHGAMLAGTDTVSSADEALSVPHL